MKYYSFLFISLSFLACNSKPHGAAKATPSKDTAMAVSYTGPFDLAKLSLKENILDLLEAQRVRKEPQGSLDKTLWGYEVFKTTDPKMLCFNNADLSGGKEKRKNQVLFHYNADRMTLAFYEMELYDQAQPDTLINMLGQIGIILFKETKLPNDALEIDENGEVIKPRVGERKTFRVWENKSTGLSYFLTEKGSEQNLVSRLIVLRRTEQSGKTGSLVFP